jgi:hypothetical protein
MSLLLAAAAATGCAALLYALRPKPPPITIPAPPSRGTTALALHFNGTAPSVA